MKTRVNHLMNKCLLVLTVGGMLFFSSCQDQENTPAIQSINDQEFYSKVEAANITADLLPRDVQLSDEEKSVILDFASSVEGDELLSTTDAEARNRYISTFLFRFSAFITGVAKDVRYEEVTAIAPTNEAFLAIGIKNLIGLIRHPRGDLRTIIEYHIIEGKFKAADFFSAFFPTINGAAVHVNVSDAGITINDNPVIAADRKDRLFFPKGIVHIIEAILIPPTQNIVEIAIGLSQHDPAEFTLLVEAVVLAGLADDLQTEGPFTVFAPIDDAFEALLEVLGEESLEDVDKDLLTQVLLYHVLSGRVYSSDLPGVLGIDIPTLLEIENEGVQTFQIIQKDEHFFIDDTGTDVDAKIIGTDVQATNGVIHVLDKVLLF